MYNLQTETLRHTPYQQSKLTTNRHKQNPQHQHQPNKTPTETPTITIKDCAEYILLSCADT